MVDQHTIDGLLDGAFDTHIHSAPDVLPRKFNDLELAQRFKARHMAGFVLKSHYICTADRATLVNAVVPEVQAFGAIALNNSVGGLNPLALDIAGRLGNKVVFLPSVDNANELENVQGQRDESKLPYWMSIAREMRALGIAGSWLNVTEDGKVTEATRQCLEIIAKHDMVLATSHIRPSEVTPVVRAAREAGVQRIVITHPEF
ncbi:MAG: cytosolic protein, partial [Chloroflexi bacterium]|nr:cytosolic protein [Chloroflexota bacterium]